MTLHSFYIFDRHCNCIYHRSFSNLDAVNSDNESDVAKLLFGVLYSLKNISQKLADSSTHFNYLKSFSTANLRIHYLETLTNLKFVLISDIAVDNLQSVLWELYSNYYVKNVVYNPLCSVDLAETENISNLNFINQTDAYLQSLQVFE